MNQKAIYTLTNTDALTMQVGATAKRGWQQALEKNSSLLTETSRRTLKVSEWAGLGREVFARLRDREGMKPLPEDKVSQWGSSAIKSLEALSSWPSLRSAADMHPAIAARATQELTNALAEAMKVDAMPEQEEDPRDIQSQIESLSNLFENPTEEQSQAMQEAMSDLEYKKAKAEGARNEMLANLEQCKRNGSLAQAAIQVAQQAQKTAEKVRACISAGLGTSSASGSEAISNEMVEIISKDETLIRIIEELGRIKDAVGSTSKETSVGHCDVVGVELAGDLRRLIPTELALFGNPVLRGASLTKMYDNALQCFALQDESPKNNGDMIVLCDRSGSMSGQRMIFARAVCLFTVVKAHKQGRRVALTMFSGTNDQTTVTVLPGDEKSMQRAIKALCENPRGGTDVDTAMKKAAGSIIDLRSPDVLMITDGQFNEPNRFTVEKLKPKDAKFTVVTIGFTQNVNFADEVVGISANPNTAEAVKILEKVR